MTKSIHGRLIKIEKHPNYFQDPVSGIIYFRKSINGVPVKISSGKTSIKEAKKKVDEKLIEMLSTNPAQEKRERRGVRVALLKDVWQELMDERSPQRHAHTVEGYWKEWNHGIKEFWGLKTVAQINEQTVRKFENWYLETKGTRTFFNTHKYLTMLFRFCEKRGYLKNPRPPVNDLDTVIRARTKKPDVGRLYTDDEVSGIIRHIYGPYKVAVFFGRYLGMRKMEALTRVWDDIDFGDSTMRVWSMKNKKWRIVPLPAWLMKEIKGLKEVVAESPQLFPARENPRTHVSSQVFDKAWKRAQRLAKVTGWDRPRGARFHDLRHTFATETAVTGWPTMKACEMLDMSVNEYQKTYVHIGSVDIRKVMERTMSKPKGVR